MELQRIELLDDKTQYPKFKVKDKVDEIWRNNPRIGLFIDFDGTLKCVVMGDEDKFLNGEYFEVTSWDIWEEIKQPTYRPYKKGDNLEIFRNTWVRHKESSDEYLITGIRPEKDYPFEIGGCLIDYEELFNEYEFLDKGIIGVNE